MLQVKFIKKENFEELEKFNLRVNEFLAGIDSLGYTWDHVEYFEDNHGYITGFVVAYETEED